MNRETPGRPRIPGRMAWASLKVCHASAKDVADKDVYPGPHGLGLIEGVNVRHLIAKRLSRIPGRMAWASLKGGGRPRADPRCLQEYPGPHGLGLIEGPLKVSCVMLRVIKVSRAAWPGPH